MSLWAMPFGVGWVTILPFGNVSSRSWFGWQQRFDVHGGYWTAAGGRAEDYCVLRQQLAAGILSATDFVLPSSGCGKYC